jgi:hypothetical protein
MLAWALGGLEREIAMARERLAALTVQAAKLRARLGRPAAAAAGALPAPRKLRTMSAAARRRISRAMKKRWAERKRLTQKK